MKRQSVDQASFNCLIRGKPAVVYIEIYRARTKKSYNSYYARYSCTSISPYSLPWKLGHTKGPAATIEQMYLKAIQNLHSFMEIIADLIYDIGIGRAAVEVVKTPKGKYVALVRISDTIVWYSEAETLLIIAVSAAFSYLDTTYTTVNRIS